MILTAHQPAYLPWLGYFDKMIRSDVFVFLDSVQYEKNSFINRNKIKTSNGAIWLTIPVKTKGHIMSSLNETEIDNRSNWQRKHLNAIYLNYKKAPRFQECYSKIKQFYEISYSMLADFCWEYLQFWVSELNISTRIIRSSHLGIKSRKSELINDLCRHFEADSFISGQLGTNYIKSEQFQADGINIQFQDYKHPVYPQLWGEFIPSMCILDFWMNTDQYSLVTSSDNS